ncbi:MAG: type II toxin-antitoxin system death-on-curing family toxin [Alphaproteobacteria bacterium]|nr:type II toxin-antitoxin system death-on-curing family toxin [Alphaproteobacteria bacterium]
MRDPVWLIKAAVCAFHDEQVAEHGGQPGLRDDGLLDSALDRPKNRFHYGKRDIFDLAAAYAFGLAKNHPFLDGNKRASLVACETFLKLNGEHLFASNEAVLATWVSLAGRTLSETEFAKWLGDNCAP